MDPVANINLYHCVCYLTLVGICIDITTDTKNDQC